MKPLISIGRFINFVTIFILAFGVIFEEYIEGYDFWGHCDIDVIWGDIRAFIGEEVLQNYDIVSCRKDFLAGHLTLWKNAPETNTIFQAVPSYQALFSSRECFSFDEAGVYMFTGGAAGGYGIIPENTDHFLYLLAIWA